MPAWSRTVLACLLAAFCFIPQAHAENQEIAAFKISSSAITDGSVIPQKFTGDGKDVSPPLTWSHPPKGTRSFALTCQDPDAPAGTWFHWIIYNLPPNTTRLKEAVPAKPSLPEGIIQGQNDFKKIGYNGPAPPRGAAHHYHFKLLALDTKLDLKPGATKKQFSEAIKGHIIGQTELVAIYSRK